MNKTIVKSMDVLYLFTQHPKLNLNDMVKLSGKPKTSVHRVVKTFEEIGFFEKDEDGFYYLGLLFLQFGQLVLERLDLHSIALPFMKSLHNEVGETIILTLRQGDETVNIAAVDSDQPIRIRSKIGERSPLYAGSPSRIILAYLDQKEIEEYLERTSLQKEANNTIIDKKELLDNLKKTKEDGYCISLGEVEDLAVGISAPIFNHEGEVIAGLTVSGIHTHFTGESTPVMIEKIKDAGMEISKNLGFKPQE